MAIHASARATVATPAAIVGRMDPSKLPRGKVLCVVELLDCVKMTEANLAADPSLWGLTPAARKMEFAWGDWRPGRWGWLTRQIVTLAAPIPARGALSLWDWSAPADLEALVHEVRAHPRAFPVSYSNQGACA